MVASPLNAPSPSSSPAAVSPARRTLVELDERLAGRAAGLLVTHTPSEAREAVLAHAARRVRAAGLAAVVARSGDAVPLWREVASRLALTRLASEPTKCAEQIANAARLRGAAIVAPMPLPGTWDRAVAVEMAALESAPLVVFVAGDDDAASDVRGERFDVIPTLDEDGKRRWWDAVAGEAQASVASDELAAFEGWWSAVKRAAHAPGAERALPEAGVSLFDGLALAGRSWPASDVAAIGGDSIGLAALAMSGAVVVSGGWVSVAPEWGSLASDRAEGADAGACAKIAAALELRPEMEPWAFARAAELWVRAGDAASIEKGDAAIARALTLAEDPLVRGEVGARWMRAIGALGAVARRELLVRVAERALTAGEPHEAHRAAQMAAALVESRADGAGEDARILLLLGRASTALGDLVAARVALDRARALAGVEVEIVALVAAEQAEVAYLAGDVATARERATESIERTADRATVLKARNTLGKVLLAEAKWDEADRHFAEDVMLASRNPDQPSPEFRARVNRAIALLSQGRAEEARHMFESVVADAERRNDSRYCAYGLLNLAHLSAQRREFGPALAFWERAIRLLHVMHDRIAGARAVANLADVRQQLGLFDHAEHAIAFGRRTLGAGVTAGRALHFGVVAARIALARGRTLDARREIDAALAQGESSGEREYLGVAHRLVVRIALEDGDLARASAALERAREFTSQPGSAAEIALLRAMLERATGNDARSTAEGALAMARTAGIDELAMEALVLLAELKRATGEIEAARVHSEQALAIRDRIADSLPAEIRTAYLARPDLGVLARLHSALLVYAVSPASAADVTTDGDEAPRSLPQSRLGAASAREIVGEDPAIRALLLAVKKIGRSSTTVLVRGESGTGKELVAEALHRASDRANGPLVSVNCAALVETLLLSELFGHERGAFTGASARRRGRFELAEGGTLFLDEIGDISPRTQVALLRVLQERTFERVGGTTALRANVRIVCATHRDLRTMVERGEFREDLYYRLRGITLEVPALRARMGDLPRIAENLLQRIAVERNESTKKLSPEALDLLGRHRWPGNIRELENALRAASLFAEGDTIAASDLVDNVDDLRAVAQGGSTRGPVATLASASDSDMSLLDDDSGEFPLPAGEANATSIAYAQVRQGSVSLSDMKRQIERDCIARALAETKGNITRAAALLGMKRPRLSQLVKQYGLAAVSSEAG